MTISFDDDTKAFLERLISKDMRLVHYRNAAIEECARVADEYGSIHGEYIAAAIRALKDAK